MGGYRHRSASRVLAASAGLALVVGVAGPAVARPDGGPARGSAVGKASTDEPVVRDRVTGRISTTTVLEDLTAPSSARPADIALGYVRSQARSLGLDGDDLEGLYVHKELPLTTGGTAVHLGQRVDGLRVRGAVVTAVVQADGRLTSIAGFVATGRGTGAPQLTARQALDVSAAAQDASPRRPLPAAENKAAAKRTYPNVYARGVTEPNPVTTELIWHPAANGKSLRLAWVTDVESSDRDWYETVVDARTGAIIERQSRYAHAGPEGTVFQEQHPEAAGAARQTTSFTGSDGSWVADRTTSGNNVNAYLDRNDDDANNEYQPQTPANGDPEYQHFDYTFSDTWRTTADVTSLAALDADRDAIVTQLFYYTNVMHEWLYDHGFDEASGNFQVDNFGRGGSGGDPVLAEAQDGWDFGCDDGDATPNELADRCLNNANFGTPADGASPRMQMYMWAPTPTNARPYRDGSMDGDVIAHEYGHGVSSRLVGGGNLGYTGSDQRGALGEGWSDVISYLKWGDAVIGEYVTANPTTGIRSVAYDNSTLDFQDYDVNAGSGHGPGQIWATVVYDIRDVLPGGVEATASLVLDGMKSTAANPTFIDARDGLLAADAGDNRCLIWSAFAGRGLGTGSTGGLDTVPTFSDDIPAECLPSADAGGPYSTPEGTNAQLDGTGSAAGTDPSAGAITSYEWDLDNDGQFDDATGATPDFTAVGQDGVSTVGLRVTDEFGNTDTDTSTVTVTNVAPTVVIDPITSIDEGGTVTVTGTVTDPGWLDDLSATIDWDDGAGAAALTGIEENTRPDATLTFSVQHQYGDDGTFVVTVCAADDDTTGNCDTENAVVDNVDPTAAIDTSGEQVYDGVSAFVVEQGEELTVPVDSTDPGSDDLTTTWDWDDGPPTDETSLVNPPATDPLKSPSVQPRDVTLESSHTFGEACLYTLSVTTADDDGGMSPADTAAVLVTGNATVSKGSGWWLNQYRNKPPNDFTAAELQCYLDIVGYLSMVFDEETDASSRTKAAGVLNSPAKAPAEVIFDQHALAAWLNFANGSVSLGTMVDTDGDAVVDATFGDAMFAAETVRLAPSSSKAEINAQKDIVERVSVQSGD